MDSTISAAWIQAGTAIVISLFTVATGFLFYQINQLHSRIGDLRDFTAELMRLHDVDNRKFRESVIGRLAGLEGRSQIKE